MPSLTPVNPEWKRQTTNQYEPQLHTTSDEDERSQTDQEYIDHEADLETERPSPTIEETQMDTPNSSEGVLRLWEDSIDVAHLYGFSGHENTKSGRISKDRSGHKSEARRKQRSWRRETFEDLTLAYEQIPELQVDEQERTTDGREENTEARATVTTPQPDHVFEDFVEGLFPADDTCQQPVSDLPTPVESTEDIFNEVSLSAAPNQYQLQIQASNAPAVPTSAESSKDSLSKNYRDESSLPSPPPSADESTEDPQPQAKPETQVLSPIPADHGLPKAEATISYRWVDDNPSSTTGAPTIKQIPYCPGYLVGSPTTSLLNLKLQPVSPATSTAYHRKELPPLLSPDLPFGLSAGRLLPHSLPNTPGKYTAPSEDETAHQPHQTRQTQQAEEDILQNHYEATASKNWKTAAIPASQGRATFTRAAVLRAAVRLARIHSQREQDQELKEEEKGTENEKGSQSEGDDRRVLFDDTAARRDLAEWEGWGRV